jgi:hypothetical protein
MMLPSMTTPALPSDGDLMELGGPCFRLWGGPGMDESSGSGPAFRAQAASTPGGQESPDSLRMRPRNLGGAVR